MRFIESDAEFKTEKDYTNFLELCIPYREMTRNKGSIYVKGILLTSDQVDKLSELTDHVTRADVVGGNFYFIFSDGGSFNNGKKDPAKPVFGSKCTIIYQNKKAIKAMKSHLIDVTNNYCEVTAGLDGLNWIKDNSSDEINNVIMVSDSQYLMKGINEWLPGWIKRNWTNNEGQPIANFDSWKSINEFRHSNKFNIYTCWIRGHQNVKESNDFMITNNNYCDIICNEELNILLEEYGLPIRKIKK